jgi:hypothetical protein
MDPSFGVVLILAAKPASRAGRGDGAERGSDNKNGEDIEMFHQ